MEIIRSAIVTQPAERLFTLVERAEDYPRFLPWCTHALILERRDDYVRAQVGFGFRALRSQLRAEVDKQPFHAMQVRCEGWPFDGFCGHWRFDELAPGACKVTFTAHTGFSDAWWAGILHVAASLIADRLVAAFVAHARTLPAATAPAGDAAAP